VLSVDAMNFLLKYVLWISAESDLCKARVFIWAFAAIATSKEFYIFCDDPNCKRVGPFFWLSCYTLFIEYSCWFKFSRNMFTTPFPWYVKLIVSTYQFIVVLGGLYSHMNGLKLKEKKTRYNTIDPEVIVERTQDVLSGDNKKI
jgi:hypothetical protein